MRVRRQRARAIEHGLVRVIQTYFIRKNDIDHDDSDKLVLYNYGSVLAILQRFLTS